METWIILAIIFGIISIFIIVYRIRESKKEKQIVEENNQDEKQESNIKDIEELMKKKQRSFSIIFPIMIMLGVVAIGMYLASSYFEGQINHEELESQIQTLIVISIPIFIASLLFFSSRNKNF